MTHQEPDRRPAEDNSIAAADLAILGRLRDLLDAADPMPADLPERIRFSLALRDLEFEVARVSVEEDERVLAARGAEESRSITFDCDSLTIMIRVDSNSDGTARIDGWLAPPQRRTVELMTAAEPLTTAADEEGRFVFTRVPRGSVRLLVRAEPGQAGSERAVMAPVLIL